MDLNRLWMPKNLPDHWWRVVAFFQSLILLKCSKACMFWGRRLDYIFIRLGHVPLTRPSLPGLFVCTCVGTLPCWDPTWQYPVKITNIQVDITFIVIKLIDEVPSACEVPKELNDSSDRVLSHWFLRGKSSHAGAGKKTGKWRRRGRGGT